MRRTVRWRRPELLGRHDGDQVLHRGPLELLADHGVLGVRLEVTEPESYGEPVELAGRERVGAMVVGVLGGDDEEGSGTRWSTPSMVTAPSSMASRKADCVRGGVRLISSTTTT